MSVQGPELRCTLFGGVRVWRGDAELELGPPKQRATLGLLLAAAGRPVTVGQLLDALWGDTPAATAVNQIHRYIGALRRLFEPGIAPRAIGQWLLPVGAGYRLATPSDLQRFRSLVADARQAPPDEATRLLVEALRIADAPPGDEPLRGLPVMVAIDDERVRAAVLAAAAGIGAGMAADVVPGLRAVAAEHLLNEPLQAALIRCLHAAGRPAEALEVYGRTRDRLRDELGTDPGADLVEAHRAVLTDLSPAELAGPAVRGPASAPAQLPAAPSSFAGRDDALAAISAGGPVTVISGMAGVGKTTLALHWAHTHAGDFPDGQLYVNLRGFDAIGRATEPVDALHDLLLSLGVPPATVPDGTEACGALLRTLLATRRLVIVLDNARDARQVAPLLPGRTDSQVIITSRNRLAGLVTRASANLVDLEPFTDDEAAGFLTQQLGAARTHDAPHAVRRLHDACGGLPLALAIVAARGVVNPKFPLDLLANEMANCVVPLDLLVDDDDREVDLRAVLTWSYRALAPDAAAALRALAVHPGPEISLAAAISLVALPSARTRTALAALTAASLLRETTPGRFAYHDLIRRYALEQATPDLAATTIRLLDHYVHSTRAACLQYGRPPLVPLAPPAPGVRPESPSGVAAAVGWFRRERAVLHATVRRAADLGVHRAVLLMTHDWRPMSENVDAPRDLLPFVRLALDAATALEESDGDEAPLALIAECYRHSAAKLARSGDQDTARAHYKAALHRFEQLGDLAGQANTLRNMATTLAGDPDERVAIAARAVRVARRCDVPLVLSTTLSAQGQMLRQAGRVQDAFPVALEGLALAEQHPGGENLAPELLTALALSHAAIGDLPGAVAHGERALAAAHRVGDIATEFYLLPDHGDALLAAGHPARAREVWQRYLSLSANTGLVESTTHESGCPAGDMARDVRAKLALIPPDDVSTPAPAQSDENQLAGNYHDCVESNGRRALGAGVNLFDHQAELDVLMSSVRATVSGRPGLTVVESPAGLGKTTLVEAFAAEVRKTLPEALVLQARCDELEHDFPFGVVRQLFEPLVATWPDEYAEQMFTGPAEPATHVFSSVPCVGEANRFGDAPRAVLHALFRLALRIAATAPVVLVVDDIHKADSPSLRWLRYLVRKNTQAPVLVVATVRTDDGHESLQTLDPAPDHDVVRLTRFTEQQVIAVLTELLGHSLGPELLISCARLTGGNPLLVRAIVTSVTADRAGASSRLDALPPQAIGRFSDFVRNWLDTTAPATREFAAALAVLGAAPTRDVVARLAGLDDLAAVRAENELRDFGLLEPRDEPRWAHALARESVLDQLSTDRQRQLHLRAAKLLLDRGADPERVCGHLLNVPAPQEPWVAASLLAAAGDAMMRGAQDSAARYLSRALDEPLAERDRLRVEVDLGLAEAIDQPALARRRLAEALPAIDDAAARAEIAEVLADVALREGRFREEDPLLTRIATDLAPIDRDAALRLDSLRLSAQVLHGTGRLPKIDPPRQASMSPGERAMLAAQSAAVLSMPGWHAKAVAELAERALAPGVRDLPALAVAHAVRALAAAGHDTDASRYCDEAIKQARGTRSVLGLLTLIDARSRIALRTGNLADALKFNDEAMVNLPLDHWGRLRAIPLATRMAILTERGDVDEAGRIADDLADAPVDVRFDIAGTRAAQGRIQEALAGCDTGADAGWQWATLISRLYLALDDIPQARRWAASAQEQASSWGSDRAIGMALRAAGDAASGRESLDLLTRSAALLDSPDTRLELARSLLSLARAQSRHGMTAAARRSFAAAMAGAEWCAQSGLAEQARAGAVATGARPRARAMTGLGALTAGERRVADRVAAGQSNRDIAATLHLTLRTVETHLSAVYRKLGITGRTQLNEALAPET